MRRTAVIALVTALAGCGSTALQGTAAWVGRPKVARGSLTGELRNTTSHSLTLDAKSMRLLDERGRKVAAHIVVGARSVPAHGTASVQANWKAGNPVRMDYGEGTLALPSD